MPREDDPVKAAFGDDEDLYDIATWEVRTTLDRVAVATWRGLRRTGHWLLVSLALVLFAGELALTGLLVAEQPILGGLAAFSILPAVALAGYFWLGDPTMREPLPTLALTFVLGVVLATIAAVVNTAVFSVVVDLVATDLAVTVVAVALFFLVVGPVEETVKWLGVRLYAYRTAEFDAVVDGVVYGAIAGLGFATIENVVYISQGYLGPAGTGLPGGLTGAVEVATSRAFVGPGHVIFSAWAGFYLGLAKFNPTRRGPIVVKGLLIATVLHATYNTAVSFLPGGWEAFVAFVVLYDGFWIAALWAKLARYRQFYRRIEPSALLLGRS
ncbi:MAG: PrsW family intramembrane metalloprotease [Haloarculaceae archaeon]